MRLSSQDVGRLSAMEAVILLWVVFLVFAIPVIALTAIMFREIMRNPPDDPKA